MEFHNSAEFNQIPILPLLCSWVTVLFLLQKEASAWILHVVHMHHKHEKLSLCIPRPSHFRLLMKIGENKTFLSICYHIRDRSLSKPKQAHKKSDRCVASSNTRLLILVTPIQPLKRDRQQVSVSSSWSKAVASLLHYCFVNTKQHLSLSSKAVLCFLWALISTFMQPQIDLKKAEHFACSLQHCHNIP